MIEFTAFNIISWSMSAVFYVVSAICLYKIGRRREIRGRWAAWIPFFGLYWMLGSIADHYDGWRKGKDSRLRIWMVICAAAALIGEIIVFGYFDWLTKTALSEPSSEMMTGLSLWLIVMIVLLIVMVAACVLYGFAMHRTYYSCRPKKAALMTTMSMVFSFWCIGPIICLLCAYRKDDGFTPMEIIDEEAEHKRLELYN